MITTPQIPGRVRSQQNRSLRKKAGLCTWNGCEEVTGGGKACERHKRVHSIPRMERFLFVGIDGEGQTDQKTRGHRYVFLAASDETGDRRWSVEDPNGLSTLRCMDLIFSLPATVKIFAYAFGYDLTKILEDLEDYLLYMLFRPELRKRVSKSNPFLPPAPVVWGDFAFNLQGSKFTVSRYDRKKHKRERRVIWDVFKFFQGKFVKALEDWKVGTKEELDFMKYMKDHREEFDRMEMPLVKEYCFNECKSMARLAKKLTIAHTDAGLTLKSYYGAGSSASAMLEKMDIKDQIKLHPPDMNEAVSTAFFGGRFENLYVGPFDDEELWNRDISSAYPYQTCFLPCLIHGQWKRTTKREDLENKKTALVRYRVDPPKERREWAPFPFREPDGSICFPESSGGGWTYLDEYIAGETIFPNVVFLEAWVYIKNCDCRPFKDIPHYYRERCRIGKEGPGIVLKLGTNSCYGKLAQSIGSATFNSWLWAGMITSGTRAQIIRAIGAHKDWKNLLMIATDGIYTREKISLTAPLDTETDIDIIDQSNGKTSRKPLGGWEEKKCKNGLFLARPGVYFPLTLSDDEETRKKEEEAIRARGLGRTVLQNNRQIIIDAYMRDDIHTTVKVANVSRFCGAKSSISMSQDGRFKRADGTQKPNADNERPVYGQWITRSVDMSFYPMPKRTRIMPHLVGRPAMLEIRALDLGMVSSPYRKSVKSPDRIALEAATAVLMEQPDPDYMEVIEE